MRNILFVTPAFEKRISEECIGTLLLATIARNNGYDSEILRFWQIGDLDNYEKFIENAIDIIIKKKVLIVSFYMRCDSDIVMLNIAERLKKRNPDIFIVLGGPQSSLTNYDIVDDLTYVDFICKGEGEKTIIPLLDALTKGKEYRDIPGLVWKEREIIHTNPDPEIIENLDENPLLDYSLVPLSFEQSIKNIWELDHLAVDVGRGCPYNCTFCSTKTFWKRKYRLKSNERIIDEIRHCIAQTGCRHFTLNHDLFTANRKRIESFCYAIIEQQVDVKWTCSSRIDTIDEELILLMKRAGMEKIFFGVETGSPRMQKIINKNLDLNKVIPLIKFCEKHGIFTITSFIYGFPEETVEDIAQTLELIISLLEYPFNQVLTHLLTIETGTEMFEKYKEKLVFSNKYSNVTEGFGRDENIEFINGHKELFPHFLEYHSDLRDELEYIPHFIGLYARFFHTMYYIYAYLEEKDILKFYRHFIQKNGCQLQNISKTRALEALMKRPEKMLLLLLEEYKESECLHVIKEILRFETDKYNLQMKQDVALSVESVYEFNYMEVINKGAISKITNKKSVISLEKKIDNDLVRIKLIKFI